MQDNDEKQEKKKKSILFLLIKRHKLKALIILFFALVANTYAWFIYNKVVSTDITAHVKAWDVSFDGAEDGVLKFELDDLYPGMDKYSEKVTLSNNGELAANVTFTVHSLELMGETYTIDDGEYTAESLQQYIEETFPFKIKFSSSKDLVTGNGGSVDLSFSVEWPYESGDDELDTYWGQKSYEFSASNPDVKSLKLVLDVNVVQVES